MNTQSKLKNRILGMSLMLTLIGTSGLVLSDDDEHEESESGGFWRQSRLDVAPVENTQYKEECGSCHFAYQPGLLPARSWQRLMTSLADHFGENAELEEADANKLTQYLVENAADKSDFKRSRGIDRSLNKNEVPLRITETRYFKRKHHELSARMVKDNDKVRSFSYCERCHPRAAEGSYNEHEVKIPGFRNWDD